MQQHDSNFILIKAQQAWATSQANGIKVFVLDTGIDSDHPDLKDNFKGGISFVPSESSHKDFAGHGTHVAGTIGATMTGSGIVGVAPKSYLYAVKVLASNGSGNWSWLISGIDWVMQKKGLRIINMSLGGSSAPQAVKDICDAAWDDGICIIAAAGNNAGAVGAPARYDSVTAVTSIGNDNVIAGTSSRGSEAEICAPGVQVLSTFPNNQYRRMSGTSMASPHVAGVAALTWGSHRFANNKDIRSILRSTADPLGNPGRDELYGFGRVDASQAAFTHFKPPVYPDIP